MATKFMSESQRRHVRKNLHEIGEAYTNEAKQEKEIFVTKMPKQINDRPRPRKPGPWRVVEIFTWSAIITIMAGMLSQWEAWEPITLPRWNLMDKAVRTEAMRYIEMLDVDLAVIAWPCTPWSIMQNLNQKPHQLRELQIKQNEHRTLPVFVEQVAYRQYVNKRATLGENPAGSHAWKEPPIQAACNRPGNSETVTHMCAYDKRRPGNGMLVKKVTRLRGTREIIEACSRVCSGDHEHGVVEGSMKLKDGKRMHVSEWAGGYTKEFAECILKGAEGFLDKHYPLHETYASRKDKEGPDEEHYASSVESDHEHDSNHGSDHDLDEHEHVEGMAEETFMTPQEEETMRDDTGNWSDEEIPRPVRAAILQDIPANIRREVRKAHNGLGHPSKVTFLKMMHLANATEAAKRFAKAWECPVCARRAAPRKPQVATGELRPNSFNKTVCIDMKYLKTTDRQR